MHQAGHSLAAASFCRSAATAVLHCQTRGPHFNVDARRHGPQRSIDTLTVLQVFEVKHQTSNRALNALISSLAEKAPSLRVQVCLKWCAG